jgi:predicted RNA-binding protein with PUA-like domain
MAKKPTVKYWLVKSEPHVFSIDDLAQASDQTTHWDGVRNYQARNMMRDEMQLGDVVLYYHSNTEEPAIVGVATVVQTGYPDFTAWDKQDPHYDPKAPIDKPRWYMVDIKFVKKFAQPLTLAFLRTVSTLESMVLLRKGSRLSVQPVTAQEYAVIMKLAK